MSEDLVSGIDERLWTEKEVAHLLHVSVHTLWVWRRQKKITFIKLPNGLIRYRKRDLEKLLNGSMCQASGDSSNEVAIADVGEQP